MQQQDELGLEMCQYFINCHQRLHHLELEMDRCFKEFRSQISKLPNDQQQNYESHIDMMNIMSDHGGERDWPGQTYCGWEFGYHYLGYHNSFDKNCCYCVDQKNHDNGLHADNLDEFCTLCRKEIQMNQRKCE